MKKGLLGELGREGIEMVLDVAVRGRDVRPFTRFLLCVSSCISRRFCIESLEFRVGNCFFTMCV